MIRGLLRGRPAFLASVVSATEAVDALNAGADIIDCKNPALGALGALSPSAIREIVAVAGGRVPVSATAGDLPADAEAMCAAAIATAATGVDFVKIGFFGDGDARAAIRALGRTDLAGTRLVAVLMADRAPDLTLIPALQAAGFAGVMLDTANKAAAALTDVLAPDQLLAFLAAARASNITAGLAGSLRRPHIAALVDLAPDILGFRGALCRSGRVSALDGALVRAVRDGIDAARAARSCKMRSVA